MLLCSRCTVFASLLSMISWSILFGGFGISIGPEEGLKNVSRAHFLKRTYVK